MPSRRTGNGGVDPRALGSALRSVVEALPARLRPPVLAALGAGGVLRAGTGSPPVGVEPHEPADWASDAEDVLDEDEGVVRALRGDLWKKYVSNFRHFIEDVIEGWRMEGRTFPSEEAKKEAIGRLVNGTRKEVKKDPRKWVREHCDRPG